ncbi:hypothetical protein BDN70DRAFT_640316 [Pholiota conissans]|uniref:Uncharacterized protein n=1 Tax=Pholiota conissans TaxID=109636 RepID=A0A9P5ZFD5_9AGAR|nr:hypothetical protein BDN70DRAFT_640316 [Pholiota conissans]
MAKKTKAKQKSDDKPAGNNVGSNAAPPEPSVMSTTVTEINYKADPPAQPEAAAWGTDTGAWGMPEAQPAGDTWGTSTHNEVAWGDDPESLLQPPLHQSHLPTIPEHVSPGGHSTQLRPSLSDIGESQQSREDSYDNDTWSGHQESPAPHYADGQQSHTLTATAALSAIGSPAIHPAISLKEAITRAQARGGTGVSSASEAARKLEESRARPKAQYIKNNTTSPAARYEPLKDNSNHAQGGQLHPPMSSASAAAALLESTSNRLRAQGHSAPKPPQQTVQAPPGKTKWEYHGRPAAAITPDPSWIMTGGNAWSNKHRQTKSATVHWGTGNENRTQQAWDAQQNQQQHHPAPSVHPRQRPQHQKHYSHPGHPMHQQSKQGQGQSWQGWGKNEWQEEDQESETETEMTDDVWNRQEGNGWGQGSNSGWDQHAGGEWVQHPQQNRQQERSRQDPGRSRKNKRHDDGYGQADGWVKHAVEVKVEGRNKAGNEFRLKMDGAPKKEMDGTNTSLGGGKQPMEAGAKLLILLGEKLMILVGPRLQTRGGEQTVNGVDKRHPTRNGVPRSKPMIRVLLERKFLNSKKPKS